MDRIKTIGSRTNDQITSNQNQPLTSMRPLLELWLISHTHLANSKECDISIYLCFFKRAKRIRISGVFGSFFIYIKKKKLFRASMNVALVEKWCVLGAMAETRQISSFVALSCTLFQ